jgi:hypothetical protein
MSIQKGRKGGPLKRQLTILITLFSENRQQKEERGQKKKNEATLFNIYG